MILRQAVEEPDPFQSEALIEAYELKLANGLLMQIYDSLGYLYTIPPFIINEPEHYGESKSESAAQVDCAETAVSFHIRAAERPDFPVQTSNMALVSEIKALYGCENARLFYNGRELADNSRLAQYNIQDKVIVQAMIR